MNSKLAIKHVQSTSELELSTCTVPRRRHANKNARTGSNLIPTNGHVEDL